MKVVLLTDKMFAIPNCSKSIGIQVLLAITCGITEYLVSGGNTSAYGSCENLHGEMICYFKGSDESMNWYKAKQLCTSLNSTLPVIRNENDQDAVAGYSKSHMNNSVIWTAGTNLTYSSFVWINRKSPMDFAKELQEIKEEDYGALDTDFKFTALAVHTDLPYICQYQAAYCKSSSDLNVADKCLRLINESRTWYDARNQCLMTDGDLAVIGHTELGFLKQLKLNESHWIGLRRKSFRWTLNDDVESNDEITYTNWDNAFSTDGTCISIDATKDTWKAIGCNESWRVVCQRVADQGTPPTAPSDTSAEALRTLTLFAAVGVGIIVVICIIVIVVFVLRTKNGRSGQSKLNDGYVRNNGEELDTRITNAPVHVYTSINEPSDVPVNRSDDMRGVYADISLLTSEQSEDGGTDQQPGTVYVSLDFNKDSTSMEPDKTISHPTFPTKVGPLGDIYAIPDARGHAVTSPGGESASRPVKVTPQGDVYAIPMKTATSPTTSPPTGAVYANLHTAATLDKEQMAEDNDETK